MIRPHLSDAASRVFWLLLAGAAGLVLGVLLVLANARPAGAAGLDLPGGPRVAPITQPVIAPVQQVTEPVAKVTEPVATGLPRTSSRSELRARRPVPARCARAVAAT